MPVPTPLHPNPPEDRALRNVRSLTDHNRRDLGVDRGDVSPRSIQSVGVIGAGVMGCSIAAANLRCRINATITDAAADAVAQCRATILQEATENEETSAADAEREKSELDPLLQATTEETDVAASDLVVESIVENVDVKRRVLGRLEPHLRERAILASNTSTIPITQLALALEQPERFCGIHFCNPVRHRKLVEIVRGEKTDDETVSTAVAYAKRLGKMPVVVNDGAGFLVNRLLFPFLNEATELIAEGATIEQVESAAKEFGMAMGPFEFYDMIGIDTSFYAGRSMWDTFRDRLVASPILPAMIKNGRLGQKSGRGFYVYDAPQRPQVDATLNDLIAQYFRTPKSFSSDDLTARLFLPMLLEATRTLEENVVRDPRDVDLAIIYGLGFSPNKGGLLYWADSLGADKILEMLRPLEGLGNRTAPTRMLKELASSGQRFYE